MHLSEELPTQNSIKVEILHGLKESPKRIASKFFYDDCGSKLFDKITELEEYYPTRTELGILRQYLSEMSHLIGAGAIIIEFGAGSGIKTRMLLKALEKPKAYIAIDIAEEQLTQSSLQLAQEFTEIDIRPVSADYTSTVELPIDNNEKGKRVIFFPGSTIGNFTPEEAIAFLRNAAQFIGGNGALLIGFDLVKETQVLEAAYNDRQGVTAEFNLNLIHRINREFDVTIPVVNFQHYAYFNTGESRIEMHLVSRFDQTVVLDGEVISFEKGEHIITEYSYKYSNKAFEKILRQAGFEPVRSWTDPKQYFEVCYATVRDDNSVLPS